MRNFENGDLVEKIVEKRDFSHGNLLACLGVLCIRLA
jgi:hypothetical protein